LDWQLMCFKGLYIGKQGEHSVDHIQLMHWISVAQTAA